MPSKQTMPVPGETEPEGTLHSLFQAHESHEGSYCTYEIQSSQSASRGNCIGDAEDALVHGKLVSMQFLSGHFQQNASLSCLFAVGYP